MSMSRKNKNKKDILEIKYKVNDDLHSMMPLLNVDKDKKSLATNNDSKMPCKAGQTRCVNNKKQYCMDLGDGQCIWMQSTEDC